MLRRLLFPILFFISLTSFAQDTFAPIGAKWWYTPWCSTPNCAFYTLESVGDTLVNGQFARILEYRYNEEWVPEATQIMYADEDCVYHYYDDSFEVLYDFSAKAGDTLKIRTGIFTKFFTYSEEEGYFFVIVDSTGSQQIDNTSLKVLYVSTIITDSG